MADPAAPPSGDRAAAPPTVDPVSLKLLQLCFDESEFAEVDAGDNSNVSFDPQLFVASKLEHVQPQVLQRDLAEYADYLEAAVLKCVHSEVHEAFVEVSGQLVSTEHTIHRVQAPLEAMEERVESAARALENARTAAKAQLHEATRHELDRAFAATQLEIALLHNALVALLDGVRGPEASAASYGAKTASLARMCTHVTRMKQLVVSSRAASSDATRAECDSSSALVDEDTNTVQALVCDLFLAVYRDFVATPSSEAGKTLSAVTSLFRQMHAEAFFAGFLRDSVVKPDVEKVISWRAATTAKTSVAETDTVFKQLCSTLDAGILSVLPLIQAKIGNDVRLLATAVWPPVSDIVRMRMMFVFAPGIPATFHQNFTVAAALVEHLESHASDVDDLVALRNSPDMAVWRSQWKLDVYFVMRSDELRAKLDAKGVNKPPFDATTTAVGGFTIPQFAHLLDALKWFLSPANVYIFALQHRFLRSACEAVTAMLKSAVDSAAGAKPPYVLALMHNCTALSDAIAGDLSAVFATAMENDGHQAVVQVLQRAAANARDAVRGHLVKGLVSSVMSGALDQIPAVKKIFSQNPDTPIPSQPSALLSDAFKQVSEFRRRAIAERSLTEDACRTIVTAVVDDVVQRATALVQSAVANAKRQQESLDKVRKTAAGSVKPRDKIVVQLYLDVQKIGDMLREFGINKEVYGPFKALNTLVEARALWIMSGFEGAEPADAAL